MAITIEHAEDLKRVYLAIFDNFAMSTSDIASELKGINSRYARELCGALQYGQLIVLTEDGDGAEAWQIKNPGTSDEHTREEAEEVINDWLKIKTPAATNATPSRGRKSNSFTEVGAPCLCGCEEKTGNANYRPGHDARHAGIVGRAVAAIMEGGHDEGDDIAIEELYHTLPSESLRDKAHRIAEKVNSKNLRRAKPSKPPADDPGLDPGEGPDHLTPPTCVEGIVKVGKQEVPGRRWSGGSVEWLDPKSHEWKPASKAATRTFEEG